MFCLLSGSNYSLGGGGKLFSESNDKQNPDEDVVCDMDGYIVLATCLRVHM